MNTIRRATTLAVVALLLVLTACAGSPPAGVLPAEAPVEEHALTAEDVGSWLDGMLPSALTGGGVPGAVVVVVKDGQVLTTRGYGWADTGADGGEPVPVDTTSTLFRVGSVSKIATAIAVMQLVEQGRLDLDADISTYLDFDIERGFDAPVTLRHLLTHTAGFEDRGKEVIVPGGEAFDLETDVKADPPAQVLAPGTTPAYSNYGISLAGYIVQRISGERFEDYVQGHVLEPAGMSSSTFDQPLPDSLADRMARGYISVGQPAGAFEVAEAPAGALTTSAPDFASFMTAQLGRSPELLKDETWEQMWSPGLGADTLGGLARGDRMGLGYWIHQRNGHRVVGHGGDTVLFHSDFEIYPEDGVGVFISMNAAGTGGASSTIRTNLMEGFADRYFPDVRGSDQVEEQADVEQSRQRAEQVAGRYQVARASHTTFLALAEGLGLVTVSAQESGNLVVTFQGQRREYEETEPWVWRQVGGHDLVAADTGGGTAGGGARLSFLGPHTLVPATATTQLLVPVLVAGEVLLAVVLVAWPTGALLRRRAVRAGKQALPALSWTGRLARTGALIALVVTPGWLLVATMIASLQAPSDLVLRVMQAAQWVSVAAVAPAAWDLLRAARSRPGWRPLSTAALLVLGLVVLAWVAWSANLLTSGTRY